MVFPLVVDKKNIHYELFCITLSVITFSPFLTSAGFIDLLNEIKDILNITVWVFFKQLIMKLLKYQSGSLHSIDYRTWMCEYD